MFIDLEFEVNGENVDVFYVVEASELAPEIKKKAGEIRQSFKGVWRFWPELSGKNGSWSLDIDDVGDLRNKIRELNDADA